LEDLREKFRELKALYESLPVDEFNQIIQQVYALIPDVTAKTIDLKSINYDVQKRFDFYTKAAKLIQDQLEKVVLIPDERINELRSAVTLAENDQQTILQAEKDMQTKSDLFDEVNSLDEDIHSAKFNMSTIIKKAKMPAGIELKEEDIFLNGFVLNEESTSDTETRLAIIELLGNLNTSGFVDIGDASLFDDDSTKQLLKIAEKTNSILIGQQVTNEETLEMEIVIND
jgi:hypothetical protein